MLKKVLESRFSTLRSRVLFNEPMTNHTSWRIGGPAEYFIEPVNVEELQKCIKLVVELDIPLTVIGNGTNLLVKDRGIPGLVVKIGRGLDFIEINGTTVRAGAGALLPAVARRAMEHNLDGFAWSAGIPGTIGGAVVMNAGANGSSISSIIEWVKVINRKGGIIKLDKSELGFSYRSSNLQGSSLIVVEAAFKCQQGDKKSIKKKMDEYIAKRRAVQPQGYPNAGSVFKNPPGDFAGRLIEIAGCKGLRVGNAEVSTKHANWIINLGGATAEDVLKLIDIITQRVKEETGVDLQLEVRVLG
ncbi:MAG: UDP-N-acetylmuramate dehydrogenase [Desulfotomaculum sp.]|nr:UDP-N-acetylmuramate dehydrogenase [Desulfotomaculum sp.]